MTIQSDLDLLLIGKTGNGKSATGNSILGFKAFKSSASTSSTTNSVDFEVCDFFGRIIKVVDGPGVGDTRVDVGGAMTSVMNAMELAIIMNPRGYHAFLLVVKFGQRFTGEEQEAIALLKKIFGETFVTDFCIVVMTCGDMFDKEAEESDQTFREWCDAQTGGFRDLLDECEHRIVLFDNTTIDESKKLQQARELLDVVDHLRARGQRYTDVNFENARETRERVILEAKEPMIREETLWETSLILQKLTSIYKHGGGETQDGGGDEKSKLEFVESLVAKADELLSNLSSLDNGNGLLNDLMETVQSIKMTLLEAMVSLEEAREQKLALRKEFEENVSQEMKRMREEFERELSEERLGEKQRMLKMQQQEQEFEAIKEKRNKERDEREKVYFKEMEEAQRRMKRKTTKLAKEYRELKARYEDGFFKMVYNVITWPLRKLNLWVKSHSC